MLHQACARTADTGPADDGASSADDAGAAREGGRRDAGPARPDARGFELDGGLPADVSAWDVYALADAAMVTCRSSADCVAAPGRPYCDVREGLCRACALDGDCGPGEVCDRLECRAPCRVASDCRAGLACCAGECVDLLYSARDCGACGRRCGGETPACDNGQCRARCPAGCPAGQTCCGYVCVDLERSAWHCGACNQACSGAFGCVAGTCRLFECAEPCGPEKTCCADGCVDRRADPNNCGDCGFVCPAGQACVRGGCVAPCHFAPACSGASECCATGCADLQRDGANCGACGEACPAGLECFSGRCGVPCNGGPPCAAGEACCAAGCIPVVGDARNCGTCERVCAAGAACESGVCHPAAIAGYAVRPSPQHFIELCASGVVGGSLRNTDDGASAFSLPFPFAFWDYFGTAAWASTNGVVGLGSAPDASPRNVCLPSVAAPRRAVFAFWDDLRTRSSGVCTGVVGPMGSRSFVIEWPYVTFAGDSTAALTFEVVLHEGTNELDVIYASLRDPTMTARARGASATVGVQNVAGTAAQQLACGSTSLAAPAAYRFIPY